MQPTRVLAVVVTYNNEQTIGQCLAALIGQHGVRPDIRVVDNASSDGTLHILERQFPQVVARANARNLGFGRAVNEVVISTAGNTGPYTHVLLINPDVYLEAGALAALLAASEQQPKAGALGGLSRRADGRVDSTCCLALPSLRQAFARAVGLHAWPGLRQFDPDRIGALTEPRPCVVPAVAGSVLLVPMSAWRAVGGFDTAYFLYGEDVDLCARLACKGWPSLFVPDCRYLHARGTSSPDPATHELRLLAGRMILYRRQLGPVRAHIAVAATVCGVGARHFASAVTGRPSRWTLSWHQRRAWRTGTGAAAAMPPFG